jgi:hypothetical protein
MVLAMLSLSRTYAATVTSTAAGGNWNAGGSWVGGSAPNPGDDVVIALTASITVNVNASCNSISFAAGTQTGNRALTINSGITFTVTNAITYVSPAANFNQTVSVSGTLNCGSMTMPNTGGNTQDCVLSVATTGIVTISGNLVMAGTFVRNHVDMTGNAVINIGGNIGNAASPSAVGGGFTTPPTTSTINLNGSSAQNVFLFGGASALGILKINNTAGVLNRSTVTVTTLTIGDVTSNSIFDDNGFQVTCTGTLNMNNSGTFKLGSATTATTFPAFATRNIDLGTTVEYDASGGAQTVSLTPSYANLTLTGVSKTIGAGTLTVRGNLTINTGATFNGSGNPVINLGGNYSNSGTFTSGTGLFTFNGTTNQSVTGTATFAGGLTINNTGAVNNNTVTLSNNVSVTGNLTITAGVYDLGSFTSNRSAAGGTMRISNGAKLTIGGTNTLPSNYTAHSIGATSTVEFDGTTNTVIAPNSSQAYGNLIISASGATTSASYSVAGTLTVTGSFIASAGTITMNNAASGISNSGTLTFFGLTISATPTAQTQYNTSYNVASVFTVNAGITFAPTAGTVTMSAAASSIANTGTKNFFNLTIAATPTAQSQYNASYEVDGTLTINGGVTFTPTGGTVTMGAITSAIVNNGTTLTFINLTIAATPTAQSQYNASYNVAGTLTVNGGVTFAPSGGTITMNNAASSIANSGTTTFNNLTVSVTPTSQAQYNTSYSVGGTLTISGAITFAPTGGTITMSGSAGSISNASGTVTFSSLSITGTTVSSTGNFAVGVTMNVSGVFNPSATSVISGAGTLTGTGTINVTRIAATPSLAGQYTITNKTLSGLTTDYNGAGAQTVSAADYGNLTISTNGTRTVTFVSGGTIRVSGVFSPTATTTSYVVTSNTFEYNGSIDQTIAAFTYNDLIVSNAGNKNILTGTGVTCRTLVINDAAVVNIQGTGTLTATL